MDLFSTLKDAGICFVTGVPDSTIQSFCWSAIADPSVEHVPAACEGGAVALAIGHWIATGRLPCVYMQNSGLLNALNPIMSLASTDAFDVPLLLVIGWRGRPGTTDEPQHSGTGRETLALLEAAGVESFILEKQDYAALSGFLARFTTDLRRGAILVSPDTKAEASGATAPSSMKGILKLDVLRTIIDTAGPEDLIVTGIGHTARQMMELRRMRGDDEFVDLPAVGGMGFASILAAGLALGAVKRRVVCIDGDGSILMHAGNLAIIGARPDLQLTHIVLENGCHASVGSHPVAGDTVDYPALGRALGYPIAVTATSVDALSDSLRTIAAKGTAGLIHVPVAVGPTGALPRPARRLDEGLAIFRQRLRE